MMNGFESNSQCILEYLALFQALSAEEADVEQCLQMWHTILEREQSSDGVQLAPPFLRQQFQMEERDFLLAMAALALENRAEIRRWCGWRLGGRVCAFYQYVLDQDPGPLRRWDRVYRCYDTLRDAKSRLLYRR